jgi:zinc protease
MKTRLFIVSLAALLTTASGQQPAQRAANEIRPVALPEDLAARYPELREIEVPKAAELTLSNGIKVYLLEDHTLPVVSGSALIRAGNLFDPPEKIGLADITGTVLRLGGTESRSGEEIDQELQEDADLVD